MGTRTKESGGYCALLLGYGDRKSARLAKAQKKWFEKIKINPKRFIKEIRVQENPVCKIGDTVKTDIFKNGDYVDVTGMSIGKGFQGGVKRWHWVGGEKGHGSMFHRAPGSIGGSSFPSRVHKGKTLPGHMGNAKTTIQNLKVIDVDAENNLLAVRGAVPGHKGSYVVVRHARKHPPQAQKETKSEKKEK